MGHYILELILWVLASFFVGCCIGCLLRKLFGSEEVAVQTAAAAPHVPHTP
ncbi:MAG: hypothetical protein HC869_08495, partial [Rhodospirillales bacterium]|nr:hypothetical protein [Rhodospirillales bacterium]